MIQFSLKEYQPTYVSLETFVFHISDFACMMGTLLEKIEGTAPPSVILVT